MEVKMRDLKITALSMIKRSGLRRVDLTAWVPKSSHYKLRLYEKEQLIAQCDFALQSGGGKVTVWLDIPRRSFEARWEIYDLAGEKVAEYIATCEKPRERTFYVMVSSHTDIGLHNSQYIQRYNSSKFIDQAAELCDATENLPEESRYRYMLEGSWVWNNYLEDRSPEKAERILNDYIRQGKIGVCAGVAGNHTHTFGLEEVCRSAYSRRWLEERGIDTKTMCMVDNNGLSSAIIQPYSSAGFKNIIFSPNQWNPLLSTVWKCDALMERYRWSSEAGGGGSRVDVRYTSDLPMLFWWESEHGDRLLVWACTQYARGAWPFGFFPFKTPLESIEDKMAEQLPLLDEKYPYDVWLLTNYEDDQEPNLGFHDSMCEWNERYEYPCIKMLGNADEPFDIIREKYADQIPVLKGDITGGWYQHPLSAAELLAAKMEVDRELATAEKVATIAAVYNSDYKYPEEAFNRAWAALIMNDEHSYGVSGYKGRRVYETWMGHRDWIEKAARVSTEEINTSLLALSKQIAGSGERVLAFNPCAFPRQELITLGGKDSDILESSAAETYMAQLPAFGYQMIPADKFTVKAFKTEKVLLPSVVENDFYRLRFAENGSIAMIYDKELGRVLNIGNCNEMMYTADNHKSFHVPEKAEFSVVYSREEIKVLVQSKERVSQADILTTVTLPSYEKRIDIENNLQHVRDMCNDNRYYRYLYFAFPFLVEDAYRFCELGGCEAEYAVDVTGHGTDVYMAAHEYCGVDSRSGEYGIGLIQLDSQLIEFDHIHPDKTDYANPGNGSAIYSYVANDWLQMHVPGGDFLNYRLRYTITSYTGTHTEAGLEKLAERIANPVKYIMVSAPSHGPLPESMSFMESDARLISLKPAWDQEGLAARLYSKKVPEVMNTCLGALTPMTVDERAGELVKGFSTLRIGADSIRLDQRVHEAPDELAIGGVETGLITSPRASHGEEDGMLYLLWGKCRCNEISHYELYRGETKRFIADQNSLIAKVEPEEFVVGRYIDRGLANNRRYYYQVRAVALDGRKGDFSVVFSGLTKE